MLKRLRTLILCLPVAVMLSMGCGGDNPTKPRNHAPSADAGVDLVVGLGGIARLIGHGSDADPADALTFAWTFVSRPGGSNATIVNPDRPTATFVADVVGTFVVRLTVSDGVLASSDDVTITASPHSGVIRR
jgi:chitinase